MKMGDERAVIQNGVSWPDRHTSIQSTKPIGFLMQLRYDTTREGQKNKNWIQKMLAPQRSEMLGEKANKQNRETSFECI